MTTAGSTKNKRPTATRKDKQEQEQGDEVDGYARISEEPEVKAENTTIPPKTHQPKKPDKAAERTKRFDQHLDSGRMAGGAAGDRNDRPAISPVLEVNEVLDPHPRVIDRSGPFQRLGKHFDNFACVVENADSIRDSAVKAQQNHCELAKQLKGLDADMKLWVLI